MCVKHYTHTVVVLSSTAWQKTHEPRWQSCTHTWNGTGCPDIRALLDLFCADLRVLTLQTGRQHPCLSFSTETLLDNEGENDQNGEDAHSHNGNALEIGIDVVIVLGPNRLTNRRGASRSGAPSAAAGSRTWALCLLVTNWFRSLARWAPRTRLLAPLVTRRTPQCLPSLRHFNLHCVVSAYCRARGTPWTISPLAVPQGAGYHTDNKEYTLMLWGQQGPFWVRPSWAFSFPCSSGSYHPSQSPPCK